MQLPYEFKAQALVDEGRITQASIDEIQEWLTVKNLPELPEELIILFLISCKNVVENTKNTIDAHFRIKNECPELFDDRNIDREDLQKAIKTIAFSSIPVRMKNNTVVHYFKVVDTNYQNFDLIPIMKVAYMLVDISQHYNPPDSLVVVIDMKGVGIMHLTRFKLHAIRKFLEFLQEGMNLKIQNIYILNANYVFDKVLSLIKAFMKSELVSILKTFPCGHNMEIFFKECVPAACMSSDYGGGLASVEELNKTTEGQFRELKDYFKAEEALRKLLFKPTDK